MTLRARPGFRIRVRRDGDDHAWIFVVHPRRDESVITAIRRVLRASSGSPTAEVTRGFATFLISDEWRPAFRLTYTAPAQGDFAGDVDVPTTFADAWL